MIKLNKIELKKIFHKKSFFIIYGLMISFCLLNNILYWKDYDQEGNYKYLNEENLDEELKNLKVELNKYDDSKESDISMYLSLKTKINILELKRNFSKDSWQYQKANEYLYDLVYQVNKCNYNSLEENLCEEYKENYNLYIKNLNQNNWQYFVQMKKSIVEEQISQLNHQKNLTIDKKTKQDIEESISEQKEYLSLLEYRLEKQIKEDNSYLNQKLEKLFDASKKIKKYKKLSKNKELTHKEKIEFYNSLSEASVNKYEIENQKVTNKPNTLNYNLRTIVEDYEIFLVIIILMVASTMICEEFHTGTIKMLLIKPYSRVKILLSKYFASIAILIFSVLILILIQLLAGGIFLGFDSFFEPVIVYHYRTSMISNYHVFIYMLIRIFAKLPLFIMLLTICFAIGIILTNSIAAVTIPLTIYMFSSSIQQLAIQYQLKWTRYLIGINWNFEDYLFGRISEFPYINFKFSLFVYFVYLIGILGLTTFSFQKKNIKNI